jgi:hypothetical protein
MNPATLPKSRKPSLLPLPTVLPAPLLGKANAVLRESILVIEVSLFWALVLVLAGFFWLGSGIFGEIETLIASVRSDAPAPSTHHTTAGGQITVNLIIVLAVITAAVAALAYEWHHAHAAKTHHRSFAAHHMRYVAESDATQ